MRAWPPLYAQLLFSPDIDRAHAELADNILLLTMPDVLASATLEERRQTVEAYYRALAADYLPARVSELAAAYGFRYERVRVKNQKTRWGSCSSRGNINLNLRLMMAPAAAIDTSLCMNCAICAC